MGNDLEDSAWAKWYYLCNDLGTVIATVDDSGAKIGVYVPDYFGNYRFVDGGRPDKIGLTGQHYDSVSGLYHFWRRILDSERGHWTSKDPSGIDGLNLYHFNHNQPLDRYDLAGSISLQIRGGTTDQHRLLRRSARRVCRNLDKNFPEDIPGVNEDIRALQKLRDCMKKLCSKCVRVKIKPDDPEGVQGYTFGGARNFTAGVYTPAIIINGYYIFPGPDAGPSDVVDQTFAHELVHVCGVTNEAWAYPIGDAFLFEE
jgi:RHS repeat-associated protein